MGAREAHQWALVAAAVLEERIKRLSLLTTRTRPDDCHHSQSRDQSRRRSRGQSRRCCKAMPGEGSQAQFPRPSSTRLHQQVTFWDLESVSEEDQATRQPSADLDLGPSAKLESGIEHFLQEPAATWEEEERSDPLWEPPMKEYERWIVWRGHQVHTPNWWQELVGIPKIDDFWELAWKIRVSYEQGARPRVLKMTIWCHQLPNVSVGRHS